MHACLASEWLLVLCEPHAALYIVICYVKVALWGACMPACMVEASIMQMPCRGQTGVCTVGRKDLCGNHFSMHAVDVVLCAT